MPAEVIRGLYDDSYTLNVTASDRVGNTSRASTPHIVDMSGPAIFLPDRPPNNILDGSELHVDQLIRGTVSNVEAGQPLLVTLNGVEYVTAEQSGRIWQVTVPAEGLTG